MIPQFTVKNKISDELKHSSELEQLGIEQIYLRNKMVDSVKEYKEYLRDLFLNNMEPKGELNKEDFDDVLNKIVSNILK